MSQNETQRELFPEVMGLFLLGLTVFTAVSLATFHPNDPSLFSSRAAVATVHNLLGSVGASLSWGLLSLIGLGAFWLPVVLLLLSIRFFFNRRLTRPLASSAALMLMVLSTAGIMALFGKDITILGQKLISGGVVGEGISRVMVGYINRLGTFLVLGLVLIVSFIIGTRISLIGLAAATSTAVAVRVEQIKTNRIKERERKIKRERREKSRVEEIANPEIVEPFSAPTIVEPLRREFSAPTIVEPLRREIKKRPPEHQEKFDFVKSTGQFTVPALTLLDMPDNTQVTVDRDSLLMNSRLLEQKLKDFGVHGQVVEVTPGPVITMYEFSPAPGIKISRVSGLADDLALALRATSVRIVAPIPGKSVIGIEIPNNQREVVGLKEILLDEAFTGARSRLTIALGKDIIGAPTVADLAKMPHLLIAGATGSGKSVCLNALIVSILYNATPDEVRFLMVDPKRIELSIYEGIPHLLHPVVVDAKKAHLALKWAVAEMERRYELLAQTGVRNITSYNRKVEKGELPSAPALEETPDVLSEQIEASGETAMAAGLAKTEVETESVADVQLYEKLPFIVIIIDELADLMMVSSKDVEEAITRLAQMARAAGIHLILATQRPSVDVLTGIIKANFPTRISFQVSSKVDSRTILDTMGAENLLGMGDMLFLPPGVSKITRIHGAFVSEVEVKRVVDCLKAQGQPAYDQTVLQVRETDSAEAQAEEYDEKYDEAVAIVTETRQASISMIQRRLRVGYNRAARMIEVMEKEGVVGPSDGVKAREVLANRL
ncbi:MAG: DNA translocase FtsK 4TM domain-containing protein [Deltaproteobacteria bacterium]|nr:DNA translocase FtsK 4TM domain-containing protein [Deltaproteobacteria bacterium]